MTRRPDENRIIDVRIALGVNWSVRENFIRLAEQSFVRLVRFGYIDGHQRPPEWMHRDPLSPAPSARGLGNPQNERRTCIEKEFLELSDIVPVLRSWTHTRLTIVGRREQSCRSSVLSCLRRSTSKFLRYSMK